MEIVENFNESAENLPEAVGRCDAMRYSGLSLAYLGDAVLELLVRERLVAAQVKKPSVEALNYVTAGAQSEALARIEPCLTDEEADAWRRGRNAVHSGVPKSATPTEYRRATGLETLFGYLHMAGKSERLRELFRAAYPQLFLK